jgi:hypothetical protein
MERACVSESRREMPPMESGSRPPRLYRVKTQGEYEYYTDDIHVHCVVDAASHNQLYGMHTTCHDRHRLLTSLCRDELRRGRELCAHSLGPHAILGTAHAQDVLLSMSMLLLVVLVQCEALSCVEILACRCASCCRYASATRRCPHNRHNRLYATIEQSPYVRS